MKKITNIIFVFLGIICLVSYAFAEEQITVVVSGQAHSSLYPCNCPGSPSGGVSRRATTIEEIRKSNKNVLVLEAGGSFAGGNFDQNSQTTELNKVRTDFYMNSLEKMGYDAVLISGEEFNFGKEFLDEIMAKYKLNYISSNLKGDFLPYLIKKVGGINVAILGITDPRVTTKSSLEYSNPRTVLANTISDLKNNNKSDFIIVLAYLEKDDSENIVEEIDGIDLWLASNNPFRGPETANIKNTTLVMAGWEARSITKVQVAVSDSSIVSSGIEHITLEDNIKDDPKILSFIPACFNDFECKKTGFMGKCDSPGMKKAKCSFTEIEPITITVIKPKVCKTCDVNTAIERIKNIFPDSKANVINADTKLAKGLIKDLGVKMLPVYLIDKSVENEKTKAVLDRISKKAGDYYMVNESFSGVSYFLDRERIEKKLDVFFDISTEGIVEILGVLEELKNKRSDIDIELHFLTITDPKLGFLAKGGKYEVEEYLRCACVNKYYPDKFWYYLSCRLSDIESSWWDDCLLKFGMDPAKIKACAQTQEGATLLSKFIELTEDLEVVFGPTFVINNQEIFSSKGAPSVEELEQLFSK